MAAGQLHRINWELSKASVSFQSTHDNPLHLFTFFWASWWHPFVFGPYTVHTGCVVNKAVVSRSPSWTVVLGSVQVSFGGDQWVSLTSKIWKERSPRKSCPFRVMFAFSNDTCGTSVCPISYGICLSCHFLPPCPQLSKLEAKSIPHGYSFLRLSWIAECAVSWMQFVFAQERKSLHW